MGDLASTTIQRSGICGLRREKMHMGRYKHIIWDWDGTLQNHARRMLERLSERGVAQSLLSLQAQTALDRALRHVRIEQHFTEVVGRSERDETARIATGRALLERLDAEPCRTLLIGDTVHDFEVAAALGTDCILVSHGHHSRDRLQAVHHDVVPSLRPLTQRPELM